MLNKTKKRVLKAGVITCLSLMSVAVFAEGPNDIGELIGGAGNMAGTTLGGFEQIAGLVGFLMFATFGFKIFNNKGNQQEGAWKNWAGLFSGVFLMSILGYQAIMVNSVMQTGHSADDIRGVITGT